MAEEKSPLSRMRRPRRWPSRKLTGLSVGLLAALTMAISLAPAAEAAQEQRGCPVEAFCIYPQNAGWNNNHPSYVLRPDLVHYGAIGHQWWNLNNQYGIHKVFNNAASDTEWWMFATLNSGYNGAGVGLGVPGQINEGRSADLNLTKVNSITLWWGREY